MFIDDPIAQNCDIGGEYYSNYIGSNLVCIGKPMTIEEAMVEREKDIYAQLQKGGAQKEYYWRNREKILAKLALKKRNK